ncbi:DUF4760 domain-containing protein [Pseudonocardia ailaonensis]|uniref:DUF4760 domain-containing protein n=1 Tax=Pseudonocardia ailaonensis TaxID=367279 RepID=UPI0031CFB539
MFSLLAILVSGFFALRQVRLLERANMFPVAVDMFKEFRSPEFKEKVWTVYQLNESGTEDFEELPPKVKSDALAVSHFWDNLAALVATGAAPEKLILAFMGGSALACWEKLWPFIRTERQRRTEGTYQEFYEDLVVRVRKTPPEQMMEELKLQKISGKRPFPKPPRISTPGIGSRQVEDGEHNS